MLSSGRSSEYEVDADGDDIAVVVAGWNASCATTEAVRSVVVNLLRIAGEHAVRTTGRIDALVFALQHHGRPQLIVQAGCPGVLAAVLLVHLGVGQVSEEVTEATAAHEVDGVNGLLPVAFDTDTQPVVGGEPGAVGVLVAVGGEPGAVVVLVADGRERAFRAAQVEPFTGLVDARHVALNQRIQGGFDITDAQGAVVVASQAHAGAEDVLVVHVVQVIVGVVV